MRELFVTHTPVKYHQLTLVGKLFKRQTNKISHKKIWTRLKMGNLKRETESILIAAQNNAIRNNYIKAKIDEMQQNSKCRLCGDRNEMISHIISACSKLALKEYKTRYDWMGHVIHWELSKKFKFHNTNICTTQNLSWRMRRTISSAILRYKQIS